MCCVSSGIRLFGYVRKMKGWRSLLTLQEVPKLHHHATMIVIGGDETRDFRYLKRGGKLYGGKIACSVSLARVKYLTEFGVSIISEYEFLCL